MPEKAFSVCIKDSVFIEECCETGSDLSAKSGELYSAYRAYSAANGEYVRSTTDFYSALETEGYIRLRTRIGTFVKGLQIVSSNNVRDEFPDFLA